MPRHLRRNASPVPGLAQLVGNRRVADGQGRSGEDWGYDPAVLTKPGPGPFCTTSFNLMSWVIFFMRAVNVWKIRFKQLGQRRNSRLI